MTPMSDENKAAAAERMKRLNANRAATSAKDTQDDASSTAPAEPAPSMPVQPGEMLLEQEQIAMDAQPAPGYEVHWEKATPDGLLKAQQRGAKIVTRGDGTIENEDIFLDQLVGDRKCLGKGGGNVMSVYPAGAQHRAAERQAKLTHDRVFADVERREIL